MRDDLLPEGVGPYRTRYGSPSAQYAMVAVGILLLLLFAAGVFAFQLVAK
jgi:hypothetical protein